MKLLKNTKYILVLLAGIMLVTGCGDKGKGGAAGGDVTALEAKEQGLLSDLETKYVAWQKVHHANEAKIKKEFARQYSDKNYQGSYAWYWEKAKAFQDKDSGGFAANCINNLGSDFRDTIDTLDPVFGVAPTGEKKAYLEKKKEFLENRLEMIKTLFGITYDSNNN